MREMKDASTDITVVSNQLFCKEETAKDFDKHFSRECNIIEVTSLQPISIMQRIVYALLEKNSFVARDADHIAFTLLSEYSRGAATIVHMLTSLMQKSEDNSRTGFELAKQQLKLHIAHLKVEQFIVLDINDSIVDITQNEPPVTHDSYDVSTSPQGPSEAFASEVTPSCTDDDTSEGNVSDFKTSPPSVFNVQAKASEDKKLDVTLPNLNTISSFVSMGIQNESYVMPHINEVICKDNDPYSDEVPYKDNPHSDDSDDDHLSGGVLVIQPEGHNVTSSTGKHVSIHGVRAKFVAGNDNKQSNSSDAMQPPTTAKPSKEHLTAAHNHPLYVYINDILTNNISLPAHHLLNSLVITGPIPLPLFYVEELNDVVMNAGVSKEKKRIQDESPVKQLVKEGVVRNACYPIVYHKDLNPDDMDTTIQPMFIPKLICDVVNDQMDGVDKALSVLSAQHALENLLTAERSLIHLHYILILCDKLLEVCSDDELGDHLLIASLKLKLRVSSLI